MSSVDLDATLAARLAGLRRAKRLNLADLALLSGVSKAMISRVERAESSPTAGTLGKLAAALGVSLAQLLAEESAIAGPLRTAKRQEVWRDPESGYRRRQILERRPGSGIELVEIVLPRSARIRYPRWHSNAYNQHLWIIEGRLHVDYGGDGYDLAPGDCLSLAVDRPLVFATRGRRACRYLVVIDAG